MHPQYSTLLSIAFGSRRCGTLNQRAARCTPSAGSAWRRETFQLGQPRQRMIATCAAHLHLRLQAAAKGWPFRLAEERTAQIGQELNTGHPCRLALWHAGDRARDRRRRAAGTAARAAGDHSHPRAQYSPMAAYSLMIERLASSARSLGHQGESEPSGGSTICGDTAAAIASTPCL